MELKPINDCLLIELTDTLSYVDIPDKQYSTKTSGIVISTATDKGNKLIHKKVYFEDFKDGTQVEFGNKKYAFIKFDDIRGFLDDETI